MTAMGAAQPLLVHLVSTEGLGVAEADFAWRDLLTGLGPGVQVFSGAEGAARLAQWSGRDDTRLLVLASPWFTLESRCLVRLHAALDAGHARALACDSRRPGPMGGVAYMTLRGMERFVDTAPVQLLPQPAGADASVVLTTLGAWRRGAQGAAVDSVLVAGAWAHDADGYFGFAREELLPLLPPTLHQVLDVGGGGGGFLAAVKAAQPQARTCLVELTAEGAAVARRNPAIDEVWQGDFLAYDTPQRFDCISFLDVLEHLAEPEAALQQARRLLAPGGVVLASIPNVGHWSVVADLLEGRWDWASVGIHCITHLRFFTRPTIAQMFQRCGYEVQAWQPVLLPGSTERLGALQAPGLSLDRDSLDTFAYLLRAAPVGAGG
jgi:SAM-dependent methyltransferase